VGVYLWSDYRGAHDVKGNPRVTELGSKDPVAEEVIDDCKGHDEAGHEHVRNGEGDNEEIPDPAEGAFRVDGDADEGIPNNWRNYHQGQERS